MVLKDILPDRFYNHFLLLSEAIYTLSQKEILYSDVRKAIVLLEKFVEDFERLYGIVNMTFNVHQLLHLGECVYRWGPLWVYSTYTFEDNNGNLLKMFNGTQAVDIQIAKKFVQCQQLKGLTRKHINFSVNPELLQLQQRLLGEFVPTKKAFRCHGGAVLMGASTVMVLSVSEIRLVKEMSNVSFKTTCRSFKKILTQKDILTVVDFHIDKKEKKARRQHSIGLLQNGMCCTITKIVLLDSRNDGHVMAVMFGQRIDCSNAMSTTSKFQLMEFKEEKEKVLFLPRHVKSKCVKKKNGKYYLSALSNLIDRD